MIFGKVKTRPDVLENKDIHLTRLHFLANKDIHYFQKDLFISINLQFIRPVIHTFVRLDLPANKDIPPFQKNFKSSHTGTAYQFVHAYIQIIWPSV